MLPLFLVFVLVAEVVVLLVLAVTTVSDGDE